jgi:hypothetical protein
MRVAAPTISSLVKETALADGAVSVRLDIPFSPPGRKPTILGDTHALMNAGFVAVSYTVNWQRVSGAKPPATPSADTVGKWVLASPSAGVLGERYLRDIAATATTYVPLILDWLESVPEVDPERFGIAGSSTNGFVALQAVAADRRLRAAVAVTACGDYHTFLRDSAMGMRGEPLRLDAAYARWIRDQEIIHHPERMTHAAVLMINQDGDELFPVACAVRGRRCAPQGPLARDRFRSRVCAIIRDDCAADPGSRLPGEVQRRRRPDRWQAGGDERVGAVQPAVHQSDLQRLDCVARHRAVEQCRRHQDHHRPARSVVEQVATQVGDHHLAADDLDADPHGTGCAGDRIDAQAAPGAEQLGRHTSGRGRRRTGWRRGRRRGARAATSVEGVVHCGDDLVDDHLLVAVDIRRQALRDLGAAEAYVDRQHQLVHGDPIVSVAVAGALADGGRSSRAEEGGE